MNANYYRMFPEYKFAFVKFQSETLSFQDAEQLNNDYKSDNNYSKIEYLLVFVDKNCIPSFSSREVKDLANSYNTAFQTNNHKIIVWLVSAPLVTAFTQLFVSQTKNNNHYCSTILKAYELLNIPIEFRDFKHLLSNH